MRDPERNEGQRFNGISEQADSNGVGTPLIRKAGQAHTLKAVLTGIVRDVLQLELRDPRMVDPGAPHDELQLQVQGLMRLLPVFGITPGRRDGVTHSSCLPYAHVDRSRRANASQRSGPRCYWAGVAPSLAAYPVRRSAPEIHHRENPDAIRLDLVQQRVRKSAEKPATNRSTEYRSGLGRSLDGLEAPINLLEEGGTEAGFLKVVVLCRLVQLILCEPVKLGSIHSPQLGPSIPKYVGR
jgi:hypothetical protein